MKYILFSIAFLGIALSGTAQSIYEIQGQVEHSPFADQEVSTHGIVTAVYSNSYFIQDGDSAWTGLYIYDQTQSPALGDSIALTGTIVEYYDMTEMKNVTAFAITSSGNTVPEPILIETGAATEEWESVFIQVKDAACTNIDLGFGEWEINDGTGSVVVNDLGVAYAPFLGVEYSIAGPLDYSFSFFKIEPRNENDIIQNLSLYITKSPYVENITKTTFDINWESNDQAIGHVKYGLTMEYELGELSTNSADTIHNIRLSNLDPASIYYAKVYCSTDNSESPAHEGVYITQSESSGEMLNFFNEKSIPNRSTSKTYNAIIEYIGKAQSTLDVAIYDLTNHAPQSDSSNYEIIDAINEAYNRGVAVRVISDDSPSNTALESLNENISLLKGNETGIMHNKFLIIDVASSSDAWILAGSTNWTYNNLFMDFNNVITIQDQSLAKAYWIEFNEMWGSKTLIPNSEESRFGNEKLDNTPHFFNINNSAVELYFSPSDKTTSKIVNVIEESEESIQFAMMAFTEDKIGDALVLAHENSILTEGIIDYVEYSGSEYEKLLSAGIDVSDFTNPDESSWPDGPTLHHKFCVIDHDSENPVVVSGTHNWSASAESKNDENTLIIYNQELANVYFNEYSRVQQYLKGTDIKRQEAGQYFSVYPNPSEGLINIKSSLVEILSVSIYNALGKEIMRFEDVSAETNTQLNDKGIYFVQVTTTKGRQTTKLVIQ